MLHNTPWYLTCGNTINNDYGLSHSLLCLPMAMRARIFIFKSAIFSTKKFHFSSNQLCFQPHFFTFLQNSYILTLCGKRARTPEQAPDNNHNYRTILIIIYGCKVSAILFLYEDIKITSSFYKTEILIKETDFSIVSNMILKESQEFQFSKTWCV